METFNVALLWVRNHSVVPMLLVFAVIVVTTYWPGRRRAIERHGEIALRDDG